MFGKRLRKTRMNKGYTQQKMADLLSIGLRSYQKYEECSREPSFDLLVQIADIFDVTTDYLLCRDGFLKAHGVSVDEC